MKIIKLLLLILLFAAFSNTNAQNKRNSSANDGKSILKNTKAPLNASDTLGVWYPNNTFPLLLDSTIYAASAIIGDTIYVQKPEWTGNTSYASTNVIKYKINAQGGGSWINGHSMPKDRIAGSMTACNGKLYYIGGDSLVFASGGGRSTNTVFEYDPITGVWTTKAPMPIKRTAHGAVCWGDSVIYVIGGPYSNSTDSLNIYYYRPATNTWGTIHNSLPSGQGRRTFSIGIYQNKIIIAGGYNSNSSLKNVYIGTIGADATQITWTTAPVMPTLSGYRLARAGGTAINGYFFVVAGQYSSGYRSDSTMVYEFSSNTWLNSIDNKPNKGDNIYNAVVSRVEAGDTIQIYVPGVYGGSAIGGTRTFDVLKYPLPTTPGIITGLTDVCQGQSSVTYFVPLITNATSYLWTLPSGATGVSNTNSITVDYGLSAISGNITVKGHNYCGFGAKSSLAITVKNKPPTPLITLNFDVLHSNATTGNQWYYQNGLLVGEINQDYTVTANGNYFDIVTIDGCSSDTSNIITVTDVGINFIENNEIINVYPNPTHGMINIHCSQTISTAYIFEITNLQGNILFKTSILQKNQQINLNTFAKGIYFIKIKNKTFYKTKKLIIN